MHVLYTDFRIKINAIRLPFEHFYNIRVRNDLSLRIMKQTKLLSLPIEINIAVNKARSDSNDQSNQTESNIKIKDRTNSQNSWNHLAALNLDEKNKIITIRAERDVSFSFSEKGICEKINISSHSVTKP